MTRLPLLPVALILASALLGGCARETPVAPSAVAVGPKAPQKQAAESVPEEKLDRTDKLVAEALRPAHALDQAGEKQAKGHRFAAANSLERLEMPLPPAVSEMPRAAHQGTAVRVQTPQVAEELPAIGSSPLPFLSARNVGTARVRWNEPDVQQPPPLPILALYQPDRAPLTDPSREVSRAIALAMPPRLRGEPAPFVPLNVPDPFANRQVMRLSSLLPEDPMPPAMLATMPIR